MKIGIIGGFGPETTAEFYMSIVNKNRTLGKSHPDILIHSVPVPFDLEKPAVRDGRNIESFLPLLLDSVKLLQDADILATTKTVSSGILETKLGSVAVLKPPPQRQSRLSEIIHAILEGKNSPEMKKELIGMVNELEIMGAEGIILGCTDLQLLLKQSDVGVTIIDTMDTLANSVIKYIGGKNV